MSTLTSSYSNAYSSIAFNRASTSDRASVGNVDRTNDVQKAKAPVSPEEAVSLGQTAVPQTTFVPQTEPGSKTTDRPQQKSSTPEKSTDAGKPRSASGDILDLSQRSSARSTNGSSELQEENEVVNLQLTPEEQEQVDKLQARDAEVRNHEAAHLAAAGQYAKGGPKFEYQTGPDGKKYAIGGSVSIDSGSVAGDPEATIEKAQKIRAAALAPADPSTQDQRVAAAASQMEADARAQLSRERTETATTGSNESATVNSDKEPQSVGVSSTESSSYKTATEFAQELAAEAEEANKEEQDQFYSYVAMQYLMNESTFEVPASTFAVYA